jgi:CHAT domain-containing protein
MALRRGELSEADRLIDRGLAAMPAESEWAWRFRLLRGEVLVQQHRAPDAMRLVSAVVPVATGFERVHARQRYLEALVQRSQNRLHEALKTLDAARHLSASFPELQLDADWLDGQIRMRLGRMDEGEARLNDVVERAAAARDRFREARALNDLGMGAIRRSRCDEALQRFERVLSFHEIESLNVYDGALSNAGICYAKLGEFDRALELLHRSVDAHRNRGPRADFEQALGELGNTFVQQGDSGRALPLYRQALAVAAESNLNADAALWAGNLAGANAELGAWDEAERFNDEAKRLKLATGTGQLVHNTLNAAQIAQGRGRLDDAWHLYEQALADAESDPGVRWSAHAGLASVAIAKKQPDRAAQHFEAALDTIERTRSELLKTDYKLSYLTSLIRFYQAYVDALVDEGRVERALEVSESSRARTLAERNGIPAFAGRSAAAFRQIAARSHTALLSYWLGPRSYVWVVTADGVQLVRLPPAKEIGALVRDHQRMIDDGLTNPLAASDTPGDQLYSLIVQPVLPLLRSTKQLVIVPDGALHRLNFETLPVPGERRHYWIEDVEIQTAPALTMLSSAAPAAAAPQASLLLIGNAAPHGAEFPTLKFAATEVANVSKHFPEAHVATYEGQRALPSAYRAAEPARYGFVHFTAHAEANAQSPLDSAIILSGPEQGFKLYARDVADVPLRAQLVTVSACRGAGERAYSGEGLVGFAWAFLHAGASRVVAGLWDVDDRSTADLMDRLYERITAGDAPARALREAKLALLARGGTVAKPYYWGPFEMFTVAP